MEEWAIKLVVGMAVGWRGCISAGLELALVANKGFVRVGKAGGGGKGRGIWGH